MDALRKERQELAIAACRLLCQASALAEQKQSELAESLLAEAAELLVRFSEVDARVAREAA